MKLKRRRRRKMFAVSCKGIGLIAGTLAYSRREAIKHLFGGPAKPAKGEWGKAKQGGYRTVVAMVEIIP